MPKAAQRVSTQRLSTSKPSTAGPCPVMQLHEKINGIWEAQAEIDGELMRCATTIEAYNELFDARRALDSVISFTRATSLQGALYQLALLREAAEDMLEAIPDPNTQDAVRHFDKAIGRLTYSVASVIRENIGHGAANHVLMRHLPPAGDPLRRAEAAMDGECVGPLFSKTMRKAAQ